MKKEEILNKVKTSGLKTDKINIDSLGDVTIKQLSGWQYIQLTNKDDPKEFLNNLVILSVFDEDGSQVFGDEDLDVIKNINSDDYAKLVNSILTLNNMNSNKAGTKNSKNLKTTH